MPSPVLYIPHGGGPLPLMGDPGHHEMVAFLKSIATQSPAKAVFSGTVLDKKASSYLW